MFSKEKIKLINDQGEEKEYYIVCSFDDDDTKETYIIYTDQSEDDDGNVQLFAAKYDSDYDSELDIPKFKKVETEKEHEIIKIVINKLRKEAKFS